MFPYFLLGIALLIGVLLLSRWYVSTSPKKLVKALKWVIFALVVIFVLWLLISGKLMAALAALPALFVWFMRLFTGLRFVQMARRMFGMGQSTQGWSSPGGSGGAGAGQGSDVHTRFVKMHLDHSTGHVSGQVLEGQFQGRALESLSVEELIDLWREAQADADSARIVESYLDRRDPDWRNAGGTGQGGQDQNRERTSSHSSSGNMDRSEALRILGLQEGAGKDEIKAAHRRLMAQVHPDKGGSDYLAQQINRAKDVLLGK